jgi:hypothetical protein
LDCPARERGPGFCLIWMDVSFKRRCISFSGPQGRHLRA